MGKTSRIRKYYVFFSKKNLYFFGKITILLKKNDKKVDFFLATLTFLMAVQFYTFPLLLVVFISNCEHLLLCVCEQLSNVYPEKNKKIYKNIFIKLFK